MRGCVQLVQVLQAFMSAPHLATPTNFFLHLAFSGPLSSPHADATRAGPTLDWPLSSYKPGSPRALTCSPLRACQSCLHGAQRLIRVAPISHLLCGLLALSSASLHRLVSQSTRNMIDWLGFLFPCAFLYTTNSPVAVAFVSAYVPRRSARHLLCPSLAFPTSFCHLCLRKVSCALPQHAISPSLPLASMCAVYNIPSRTHTEPAPQCRTWPSTLAG